MFKIERFDHMHVNPEDFKRFSEKFETFMGHEFFMKQDMTEQYGTDVVYEPAPVGVEVFRVTDASRSFSAKIAEESSGVFCVCYKVANLKEAIADMENMGYKMLEYIDNSPILEAVFDTKEDFGFYIELTEYPFESMRDLAGM